MRISTTAHYGLIAAGYIAEQADERLVLASRIAEEYDIPLEYLFKILQQMVKADILRSKRGERVDLILLVLLKKSLFWRLLRQPVGLLPVSWN